MRQTLDLLKALTLMVAIMVGASLVLLLFQVSSAVKHADDGLRSAVSGLNGVSAELDGAIGEIRRTAALSSKLIGDARLSADNLNKAALDERFYFERQLPGLMDQAHGILANVQTATGDLDPLLKATTARTEALAPLEGNAAELVADVDRTAKDPRIAASLGNLEASSAQLAVTSRESAAAMESVQAMAADGEEEVRKLTHPKPLVTIADWTLKVVHALGGFF